MPKVEIVPNCRYGHGDLEHVEGDWGLQGYHLIRPKPTVIVNTGPSETAFTVMVYRCPTCGYVELKDVDGDDEDWEGETK